MLLNKSENIESSVQSSSGSKKIRLIFILLLIVIVSASLLVFSNMEQNKGKVGKAKAPTLVSIAQAKVEDVPLIISTVGNVEATETVSIRARVDGELVQVYFKEGDYLKKGDPLFKIDPRPFEQKVRQASANLSQAHADALQQESLILRDTAELRKLEANLENDLSKEKLAKRQWDRYKDLVRQGAVSQEQEDQIHTTYESSIAAVKADRAAIDNQKAVIESDNSKLASLRSRESSSQAELAEAKLMLSYCLINSPIDGKSGSLLVHQGNMIKAGDAQPLVIINKLQPIYVSFSLPESDLLKVKHYEKQGQIKVDVKPTEAANTNHLELKPEIGILTFMDNSVQTNTGTIRLKATFDNKDRLLWPGQFLNVTLHLDTLKDCLVVPSQAIQIGQNGQFVYVVDSDNKAQMRPVKVGVHHNNIATIESGLKAGDKVVVDGQMQLAPDAPVNISTN